jgi:hypothetical protein
MLKDLLHPASIIFSGNKVPENATFCNVQELEADKDSPLFTTIKAPERLLGWIQTSSH